MTTRAQVVEAIAEIHADAHLSLFDGTVTEAAERAHRPGGPSLAELEQRIRAYRNNTETPAASTPPDAPQAAAQGRRSVPVLPSTNAFPPRVDGGTGAPQDPQVRVTREGPRSRRRPSPRPLTRGAINMCSFAHRPEWVTQPTDPHADELMHAAWTWRQGETERAIDQAIVYASWELDRDVVVTELAALAELLGDYEECWDSPALYAYRTEGRERPGQGSSWIEYSEAKCEEILRDARALAFRLRHARVVASV